jgi:ubiquinone/menaquinone biosynthesis C-methylase UbiE
MENYLKHKTNINDKELISIIDELPLWAAPFGLSLLNKMKIGKGLNVLDIGCGTGFPLVEIAQRLGETSHVYGIDPWKEATDRAQFKIDKYGIKNITIINGYAENLPFDDSFFDVIVSNNGINNVEDLNKTFSECSRVGKKGAQFLFTMNLDGSMLEFYNVLHEELEKDNNTDAVEKMKNHIYEKRRPLNEIKQLLKNNSYVVNEIYEDKFFIRFADGSSMFKHSFIKYWFLESWKKIIEPENQELIFSRVEAKLNNYAVENGELKLTIPFAVINCARQ